MPKLFRKRPRHPARPEVAAAHPLTIALSLLRADAPKEIIGAPQSWPAWALLLPHVLAATARLDPATADPPVRDDASWLLDRAGTYLQVHARLTDARLLLERALAMDEAAYGSAHPAVAAALNNLATILWDLGQPDDARPLADRAQSIRRKRELLHNPRPRYTPVTPPITGRSDPT